MEKGPSCSVREGEMGESGGKRNMQSRRGRETEYGSAGCKQGSDRGIRETNNFYIVPSHKKPKEGRANILRVRNERADDRRVCNAGEMAKQTIAWGGNN